MKIKNKKLFAAVLVLCLVLIGGAMTAFVGMRNFSSDGRLLLPPEEHETCVFNISTGAVPAASDPDGVGYELFACSECGEMSKVIANHESGHCFRTLNGVKVCACGALSETIGKSLGKNEFSSLKEDISIRNVDQAYCLEDSDGDGEPDVWNLSARNIPYALYAEDNSNLSKLLRAGSIDFMNISFDFPL